MDTQEAVAIIREILDDMEIPSVKYPDGEIGVSELSQVTEDRLFDAIVRTHFEVKKIQVDDYKTWEIAYHDEYFCLIFFEENS
jgi:hypothetical protein